MKVEEVPITVSDRLGRSDNAHGAGPARSDTNDQPAQQEQPQFSCGLRLRSSGYRLPSNFELALNLIQCLLLLALLCLPEYCSECQSKGLSDSNNLLEDSTGDRIWVNPSLIRHQGDAGSWHCRIISRQTNRAGTSAFACRSMLRERLG